MVTYPWRWADWHLHVYRHQRADRIYGAALDFEYDGKRSHFSATDAVQVEFEAIRNPVTGADHMAAALLPTGLLTKREDFFAAKAFAVKTDSLNFSYPGRNALAFTSTWRGP